MYNFHDRNESAACEKKEEKTISSGLRGRRVFFMRGGEEFRRRERECVCVWTSLARFHPRRTSRCSFHAHFINSNLSSAENWIRLIPTIDARLRPGPSTSMRMMHDCIEPPEWNETLDCFTS